jgi:hypothetical protein
MTHARAPSPAFCASAFSQCKREVVHATEAVKKPTQTERGLLVHHGNKQFHARWCDVFPLVQGTPALPILVEQKVPQFTQSTETSSTSCPRRRDRPGTRNKSGYTNLQSKTKHETATQQKQQEVKSTRTHPLRFGHKQQSDEQKHSETAECERGQRFSIDAKVVEKRQKRSSGFAHKCLNDKFVVRKDSNKHTT